jgi:hypothetical protein
MGKTPEVSAFQSIYLLMEHATKLTEEDVNWLLQLINIQEIPVHSELTDVRESIVSDIQFAIEDAHDGQETGAVLTRQGVISDGSEKSEYWDRPYRLADLKEKIIDLNDCAISVLFGFLMGFRGGRVFEAEGYRFG